MALAATGLVVSLLGWIRNDGGLARYGLGGLAAGIILTVVGLRRGL
jgi:hypothetical protein